MLTYVHFRRLYYIVKSLHELLGTAEAVLRQSTFAKVQSERQAVLEIINIGRMLWC